MTPKTRFLIGGGGALMPVLVSILAIDIGAALNDENNLSPANLAGFAIRYVILFILGGVVGFLHEDEEKPFKLFELGVAAPALITSFITAQGISPGTPSSAVEPTSLNFSIIGSAYAEPLNHHLEPLHLAWTFSEVLDGITGKAYQKVSKPMKVRNDGVNSDESKKNENDQSRRSVNHNVLRPPENSSDRERQ